MFLVALVAPALLVVWLVYRNWQREAVRMIAMFAVALATVGPVEWFIPGTGLVSFCQAVVLPVFLELVAEAHCKVSRKEMERVIEECFPA